MQKINHSLPLANVEVDLENDAVNVQLYDGVSLSNETTRNSVSIWDIFEAVQADVGYHGIDKKDSPLTREAGDRLIVNHPWTLHFVSVQLNII